MLLSLIFLLLIASSHAALNGSDFEYALSREAFEFAAASYADNPWPCLKRSNSSLILQVEVPCDTVHDKCWAIVINAPKRIVVAFQGTASKTQLINELIETVVSAKHYLDKIGSVERYFYVALKSIQEPIAQKINKLREAYPEKQLLFTGHSLGGALASLAATLYASAFHIPPEQIRLVTFGQPRVGNHEYAMSVDRLIPKAWRIVHGADLVAHVPYCISLFKSCGDFFNHSPYHHGTEVWFPKSMGPNGLYRVCSGLPEDEDSKCSNNQFLYNIDDHLRYFDVHVSDYGIGGCAAQPAMGTIKGYRKDADVADKLRALKKAAYGRMIRDFTDYLEDIERNRTGSFY